LQSQISEINADIQSLADDNAGEEVIEAALLEEESYDCTIDSILLMLQPIPPLEFEEPIIPKVSKVKLPTIALPKFANDKGESLEKFVVGFESIINKQGVTEYEKFVYLKSQLSKAPLSLVNSLDATEQTYTAAIKLLKDAFASPLMQQYQVIKQLSNLRLNSGDDVYSFISEYRNLISSIKTLKIDINTVIQYFVWSGMNDLFQNQLINISNKSKPSLKDINDNIFAATDRYLKLKEQNVDHKRRNNTYSNSYQIPVKTNGMAVNISKPMILCNLCLADGKRNVTHTLRECKVYQNAKNKVDRLELSKTLLRLGKINTI